ncbi:ClpX C4-type zinc finger protein [Streptomyces sp. NPDC052196]|uniref:ClpX C4-type zinc finger protein n=1 Tax=Streptomyces sp. NPDC052196 TaxID=3156691 RepID=UPI0034137DD2
MAGRIHGETICTKLLWYGPGRFCCSFCGKPDHHVENLVAGPGVNICSECLELFQALIQDE